jgi:hypothetical protein
LLTFQQVIQKENEDVTEKMRENIGNGSVGAEFIEPVSDE